MRRKAAGEADSSGGRRTYRRAFLPGDVDAAVLPGGVRVAAEGERA